MIRNRTWFTRWCVSIMGSGLGWPKTTTTARHRRNIRSTGTGWGGK